MHASIFQSSKRPHCTFKSRLQISHLRNKHGRSGDHLPTSGVMSGVVVVGLADLASVRRTKVSASCCLALCRNATVTYCFQILQMTLQCCELYSQQVPRAYACKAIGCRVSNHGTYLHITRWTNIWYMPNLGVQANASYSCITVSHLQYMSSIPYATMFLCLLLT